MPWLIRPAHGSGLDTRYSAGFLRALSQCLAADGATDMCVQCHQNIWQGEGNASPRVEPFNSQVDPHISLGVFHTEIGVVGFIMPLSPVGPRQPEDSPR